MKRAELIAIVDDCATRAAVPEPDKATLIEAVSNPSVTEVARGDWRRYVAGGECYCPAMLAGFATATGPTDELYVQIERFATYFDRATRFRDRYDLIIEIED